MYKNAAGRFPHARREDEIDGGAGRDDGRRLLEDEEALLLEIERPARDAGVRQPDRGYVAVAAMECPPVHAGEGSRPAARREQEQWEWSGLRRHERTKPQLV